MKKYISILIIILMISSLIPSYAIETVEDDITGHWAEEIIKKWKENELMKGYPDGSFRPNDNITKAEFITLVNRIYGYYEKADENYRDVKENDWYYNQTAIAKANKYMEWYQKKELKPNQKITRQEVCAMIAVIQQLEATKELTNVNSFNDKDTVPKWSKSYIDAVLNKGYIKGYPDNTVKAEGNITRSEVVTMINRVVGELVSTSGTYGKKDKQKIIEGNLTINARDVTLKNTTINGNLVLAAGIGQGDVDLENVKVKGKTIINGGGENSIKITGSNLGEIKVYKIDGQIRVVLASSEVESVILQSGGELEGEYKDTAIIIDIEDEQEVILDGNFDSIVVDSEVNIQVTGDSLIKEIIFNAASEVTGKGKIIKAILNVDEVNMEQKVEEKKVANGIKGSGVKEKSKSKSNSNSRQDRTAPSGYSIKIAQDYINNSNKNNLSFTFSGAEINTTYNYSIDDTNKNTLAVTGSGIVTAVDQTVLGINVSSLDDDTLTLTVYLTDPAENQGSDVRDTVSKETVIPSGYSVSIDQSEINPSNVKGLSFTFSGAELETTYNYTISSDGGGTDITGSATISAATEQIAGIDVSGLKDGTLTLTVSLTDQAGNQGKDETATVNKNATPPIGYDVNINQDYINISDEDKLSFTFSGAEIGAIYNYSIDDTNGSTPAVTGSGTITAGDQTILGINVSSLDDDTITLTVYLTDTAGNQGSDVNDTIMKDTVIPSGYSVSIDQSEINPSNETHLSFKISGAEIGAKYNYTISSDGGGTDIEENGKISKDTETITGIDVSGLEDGTLTLTVLIIDIAGNKGNDETTTVSKDANPPSGYGVKIIPEYIIDSNKADMAFIFSGAEINTTYSYSIDDTNESTPAVIGNGKVTKGDQTISGINVSSLDDDTITLTVYLTDTAGHRGSDVNDTVMKDTVIPSGYSVSIDQSKIDSNENTPLSFKISGAEKGGKFNYTISSDGGGTDVTGSGNISTTTEQITGIDVNSLEDGLITLEVTLMDKAGNKGVIVEDTVIKISPGINLYLKGIEKNYTEGNGIYEYIGLGCEIRDDPDTPQVPNVPEDNRPYFISKNKDYKIIWLYYEGEGWRWVLQNGSTVIYLHLTSNEPSPPNSGWWNNINSEISNLELIQ